MCRFPCGLAPIIRDTDRLFGQQGIKTPSAIDVSEIPVPQTDLTKKAKEYLSSFLPKEIWNHSHRAFLIGSAIVTCQFHDIAQEKYDSEAFYLSCLFHDIGATPENLKDTRMSFEFYGGMKAREFILQNGPQTKENQDLADSVAEAIFRHTNFVPGSITFIGQIIQLATVTDVIGKNPNIDKEPQLIHRSTIDSIVNKYPRLGWNEYFSNAMLTEMELKPWSMTTSLEDDVGFTKLIKENPLMAQYDQNNELPEVTEGGIVIERNLT